MRATISEQAFHHRLLSGDPTALAELADAIYEKLVRRAICRAGVDCDLVVMEEAVQDALLGYGTAPQRYNPEKLSLESYLVMVAFRDYQNLQRQERQRCKRQASLQEHAIVLEELVEPSSPFERLVAHIIAQQLWPEIDAAFSDPLERRFLMLMLNGERSWEAYRSVLGLADQPDSIWKPQVKRVKDRITKRLQRIGDSLHE